MRDRTHTLPRASDTDNLSLGGFPVCPICIATAAWLSAGVGSTGGLTALLVNKHRSKRHSKTDSHTTAANEVSAFASAHGVGAQAGTSRNRCGNTPSH
jgi:hypothetical protein